MGKNWWPINDGMSGTDESFYSFKAKKNVIQFIVFEKYLLKNLIK